MIKVFNYDIVFREVPDETTLALNLSNCPFRCEGCHSPYLRDDVGDELTRELLDKLIRKNSGITCIAFMGGDGSLLDLSSLMRYVKETTGLKTAWYSGSKSIADHFPIKYLDYIKIGPYISSLGGLESSTSNQKFYKVDNEKLVDITYKFRD